MNNKRVAEIDLYQYLTGTNINYVNSGMDNKWTASEQQVNTNKNNKNIKNIKNNNSSSVIKVFEEEIGILSGTSLQELLSYTEEMSEDLVIEAIHIANRNNKRMWSYVKAILNSWQNKGYKTLKDVKGEKKIIRPNFTDNQIQDLEKLYEN